MRERTSAAPILLGVAVLVLYHLGAGSLMALLADPAERERRGRIGRERQGGPGGRGQDRRVPARETLYVQQAAQPPRVKRQGMK